MGADSGPYSLAPLLRWSRWVRFFILVIIHINGEEKEIEDGLKLTQLLDNLGIRPGRVVVELNRNVLSRDVHGTTLLREGDSLEIVQFVGGG